MTLRDNRLESIRQLRGEITALEGILKKKKKLHDELSQSLLSLGGKSEKVKNFSSMFQDSEKIQQLISENLTDIHHFDAKIAKMKHRLVRMEHVV